MDESALQQLSRANKGVARRTETLKVCSRRSLNRLIDQNRVTVMHDGVLALSPAPVDAMTTARAALVWANRELVASHRFAAWLHRLDGSAPAIEFSDSYKARYLTTPGIAIHRVRDLPPSDVCVRRGFRTTTLSRTVLDLAASPDVPRSELVCAFEDANRRGSIHRTLIIERIEDAKKSQPRWDALLQIATRRRADEPPTESAAESICDDILACAGILPDRQHELFNRDGNFVARLDFAFPFLKLAIEVDGFATHGSRHAYYRDKRRMQEILRLGWQVIPIVWADLMDAPRLLATVRDIIHERRKLFRSTTPIGPNPTEQLLFPL